MAKGGILLSGASLIEANGVIDHAGSSRLTLGLLAMERQTGFEGLEVDVERDFLTAVVSLRPLHLSPFDG